jgi:hypothetical protein
MRLSGISHLAPGNRRGKPAKTCLIQRSKSLRRVAAHGVLTQNGGWRSYAYIPEGNARRSSIRVPIIRDHVPARMLLGFGGLAGRADDHYRRNRLGALAKLALWPK